MEWEESGASELAREAKGSGSPQAQISVGGALDRNSDSMGILRKIRLKSCPEKAAVVQGELHFNTCGKFFVVLIQSVAAAEGEAQEGTMEVELGGREGRW